VADAQQPITHAAGVLVLSLDGERITSMTRFLDPA
jgi:hypothetical protein